MTEPTAEQVARARKFACDWTSCWADLACPGLDGGDHNQICDSLTREALREFAALARVRLEAHAAGRDEAFAQCKAADYLTESLRDPSFRPIFMEEWKRDNAWMEGCDDNQADVLKVLDERIAKMRGGPRLAEAREIRDAIRALRGRT